MAPGTVLQGHLCNSRVFGAFLCVRVRSLEKTAGGLYRLSIQKQKSHFDTKGHTAEVKIGMGLSAGAPKASLCFVDPDVAGLLPSKLVFVLMVLVLKQGVLKGLCLEIPAVPSTAH